MPRNVLLLGATSLFTDVSSEMISSTLPLYAIFVVGLTPLQFGILDGIYQGASALLRLVGGVAADRLKRHKEVATTGYAISAAAKLGLLASGAAFAPLVAAILADRIGKGVRTASRDALISLSVQPERLASAFGIHRALDTLGAFAGPIAAFAVLFVAPGAYDAVFVTSFCFAIVGVAVIGLFVKNQAAPSVREDAWSIPRLTGLVGQRGFVPLLAVAVVLALATVSDGFLYLVLQRRLEIPIGVFPLLYVATALVYFSLAIPMGRLADRIGRHRVFLAGYALLPIIYVILLSPGFAVELGVVCLVLLGAFYAATDGVLAALASTHLGPSVRAGGLATLGTVVAVTRVGASILFGAIWAFGGIELAMSSFVILALAALAAGAITLRRVEAVRGF
jgi:MFS family permease